MWTSLKIRADKGAHFLPAAGGMMDQPAAMMDAFAVLDRCLADNEAEAS
jgi:hypothetical protein